MSTYKSIILGSNICTYTYSCFLIIYDKKRAMYKQKKRKLICNLLAINADTILALSRMQHK